MNKLTNKQQELFNYLKRYKGERTTAQICKHMNWVGNANDVYTAQMLKVLLKEGYIDWDFKNIDGKVRRKIRILQ